VGVLSDALSLVNYALYKQVTARGDEGESGGKVVLKTTFSISKMDCPSEERMIRMKLEGLTNIQSLQFDIPGRKLDVYHTDNSDDLLAALESLQLDTKLVSSEQTGMAIKSESHYKERQVLWQVLAINIFFFTLELLTGIIADSMGLVADSLDMLADSIVYGLSLYAVGGTISRKKNIAGVAGYFQLVLAISGFVEVIRRFVGHGETPDFNLMIIISLLALTGNAICLYLLQKAKSQEAHMKASMIFTSTDVIVNLGVIVAGVIVYMTTSQLPDLIVGAIVFMLVGRGAYRILQLSK
jgi:cation transport ATPase